MPSKTQIAFAILLYALHRDEMAIQRNNLQAERLGTRYHELYDKYAEQEEQLDYFAILVEKHQIPLSDEDLAALPCLQKD